MGLFRDSSDLVGDGGALHERMQEGGFLLLRGLIDRKKVFQTRQAILPAS